MSGRDRDAGGDGMNTLILYVMGFASLVVIIAGAFFVVTMIAVSYTHLDVYKRQVLAV